MDRASGPAAAISRAGSLALISAFLGMAGLSLAGCTSSSSSPSAVSSPGTATASASPGLSVPGTHQATARYQITAPVSTVVIISHVGNVTVTGGSGPGVSATQLVYYSKTAPTTTRTVSGKTLTVTYDCRTQLVCGVAYTLAVPRSVAVRVTVGAGSVRLTGLAGSVTAKADVGLINATGLTSASVSLTTRVGGISASFTAAPTAVQASANVGAITVHVPGSTSYKVAADARVGKTTVSAPQSASSGHAITATTDIGAIVVAPSP
jgi:Putative adhesin